jgi:hypothetical protein
VERRLIVSLIAASLVAGCSGTPPQQTPSPQPVLSPAITATPQPSLTADAAAVGRDPSGIPETLNGQPVEIGLAAVVHALATTDATPFLVGGWFTDATGTCSGGIDRDPSPLLSACGSAVGVDAPLGYSGPQGQMYWNGHHLPGNLGPSIVKVHTHDPAAAACRSVAQCQAVLVVDDVLWTGDAWTNGSPISVAQAMSRFGLNIIEVIQTAPNTNLSVQRTLFTTPVGEVCPSPWPHEVFELHGDPRVGLIAVFPDEAARISAQAALDPAAPGCAIDPRIVRPAAAAWVGVQNVLVLVYGADIAARTQAALSGSPDTNSFTPFPPASLDESYRVVNDVEAARASGILYGVGALVDQTSGNWYGDFVNDMYRRFEANALTYSIGQGRPVTEAAVGATVWAWLEAAAVPGTARLYAVDHPASTDPALAQEVVVAFEEQHPQVETWGLILVRAGPTP